MVCVARDDPAVASGVEARTASERLSGSPAIVCDEQYDAEGVETAEEPVAFINDTPQDVAMTCAAGDFAVFDPPLQGGALIAAGSGRMAARVGRYRILHPKGHLDPSPLRHAETCQRDAGRHSRIH